MNPQVVYSVGVRLGTTDSLGLVAGNAVQALAQAGWLQRLLVSSYRPGSVPAERTLALGLAHRAWRRLEIYDASGYMNWVDNLWFDRWASRRLGNGRCLHVWNHFGLASLAAARRRGWRTIVERASSHNRVQQQLLSDEYRRHGLRYPAGAEINVQRALAEFDQTDFILVPSDFARDSFLEQGFAADRLITLPFGVDTQRFTPAASEPDGIFRAVFAGQVSLRKGLPDLLRAWEMAALPEAELMIVGNPTPDAQAAIQPYRRHPAIRWVSYTPRLAEVLQTGSVFVFPSIEEGSALVTYLALACGLPVVTTPNAGSVVRDGVEGRLVPIRAPEALAAALRELWGDSNRRTALRQAARQRALEFTWERYQARLIEAYRQRVSA